MYTIRKFFVIKRIALILMFGLGLTASINKAQTVNKPLTNSDIIRMSNEKVDESIILEKIRTSDNIFDTTPDGLIQLKKAKLRKSIIEAMMKVAQTRRFTSTPSSPSSGYSMSPDSPFEYEEKAIAKIINEPTIQAKTSQFFSVELKRCNNNKSVIVCYFVITNKSDDKELKLAASDLNLIDNQGNEKKAIDLKIGGDRGEDVTHLIPQGVPILVWIRFERQSLGITKIVRLNLKMNTINDKSSASLVEILQFRDINLLEGIIPFSIPRFAP